MPDLVSLNHQAEPCWILPGSSSDWKQPSRVSSCSLSAGNQCPKTILYSLNPASRADSSRAMSPPQVFWAIMSKPVSGPILANIRSFMLRTQE